MSARRTQRPTPSRLRAVAGSGMSLLAGLGLAGVLVLAALAWMHFDPEALLPVRHVTVVDSLQHADAEQIAERSFAQAPGWLGAELESLRADLQKMPWVDRVELRRRWPDTLEIRVSEPVPVAQWGEEKLVDRHGRLFGPVDLEDWAFLPALEGEDGRQVVLMHRYLEVSARLADAGFEVTGLAEGRRHDWEIHLAGGAKVLMGRDEDLTRLGQLVRAAPAIRAYREGAIERVDLRYPHGLAVAWDEASEAPEGPVQ